MNRKPLYLWIVPLAAVVFASSLAACGDDSSSTPATAKSTCEAFCVKEDACDTTTTIDDCKMYRCGDLGSASADCQEAVKAYFDCANGLTDPCVTTSCDALDTAFRAACS